MPINARPKVHSDLMFLPTWFDLCGANELDISSLSLLKNVCRQTFCFGFYRQKGQFRDNFHHVFHKLLFPRLLGLMHILTYSDMANSTMYVDNLTFKKMRLKSICRFAFPNVGRHWNRQLSEARANLNRLLSKSQTAFVKWSTISIFSPWYLSERLCLFQF